MTFLDTSPTKRLSFQDEIACNDIQHQILTPTGAVRNKPALLRPLITGWLPSGYVKIAIEHGHRNSEFSH